MATNDKTDESTRDFYPENAQEINFDAARKTAEENAAADAEAQKAHQTENDTPSVIPAQPDQTESTNPEQVKLDDGTTAPDDTKTDNAA